MCAHVDDDHKEVERRLNTAHAIFCATRACQQVKNAAWNQLVWLLLPYTKDSSQQVQQQALTHLARASLLQTMTFCTISMMHVKHDAQCIEISFFSYLESLRSVLFCVMECDAVCPAEQTSSN
jgi:hypothetical protein